MRRSRPFLVGFATLASLSANLAMADDTDPARRTVPSISVTGQAQRQVSPDMAVVTLGVTTERPSAQDAARVNGTSMQAVIKAAKAAGVAEADVATTQATLMPVYDQPGNGAAPRIKAFRASNSVSIKVHQLDRAGDLVGQLIDQGANALQGIDLTIADPEPIRDALRAEAALNARHRAELFASTLGLKLGRILLIAPDDAASEPIPARPMRMAVAAAPMPVEAGTQTIDAHVTITWALGEQP